MHYAWRSGGRWRTSERQLARSGHNASSRHWRAVRTRPGACAEGHRSSGPGQSMPAWPLAGFEIELGRTEQWAGLGSVHNVFPII
jgi:hypothetical protein